MRNLLQYPITKEEVLQHLQFLHDDDADDLGVGNMHQMLLQTAMEVIKKHGID